MRTVQTVPTVPEPACPDCAEARAARIALTRSVVRWHRAARIWWWVATIQSVALLAMAAAYVAERYV